MSEITKVAIVDDDRGMRELISSILREEAPLQVVASLGSGEESLEQLPGEKPDIVLMDINMKGIGGVESTRQLKLLLPETKIVMLTVFEDSDSIFSALAAGADGYLLKHLAANRLVNAISDALGGGAPMSAPIARKVVASFRVESSAEDQFQLSPREREVLESLAEGLPYKLIATKLKISMGTVRTYIERIYQKLHVHCRTDAVLKYLKFK